MIEWQIFLFCEAPMVRSIRHDPDPQPQRPPEPPPIRKDINESERPYERRGPDTIRDTHKPPDPPDPPPSRGD